MSHDQQLLDYAKRVFREYHAQCFWHWKSDATITEETIPSLIKGLCTHGGRDGLLAAARLQELQKK